MAIFNSRLLHLESATVRHGIYRVKHKTQLEFVQVLSPKKRHRTHRRLLIFIHGHNSSAPQSIMFGYSALRIKCDALLISMPGYGLSSGPADYSGPQSAATIEVFLKAFLAQTTYELTFLWGISRGAILSGLVAARLPCVFNGVILQSGAYDFAEFYKASTNLALKNNIRREAGISMSALRDRTTFNVLNRYKGPVLLLHGATDQTIPVRQAILLAAHRNRLRLRVQLAILKGSGHLLPMEKTEAIMKAFLNSIAPPSGRRKLKRRSASIGHYGSQSISRRRREL